MTAHLTDLRVQLPFRPRPWQVPLLADRAARIVAVVHRRAGKSTGIMWRLVKKALVHQRLHLLGHPNPNVPGTVWTIETLGLSLMRDPVRVVHTLPLQVQWDRTGMWDRLKNAARAVPGARWWEDKRRVQFPNGAIYQTGGMDNPDSWRGGYADEICIDEYDDTGSDPMVIEPMLADFSGVLLRSGTPKGNGRLEEAFNQAGLLPGHSRYLLTYLDTGVLSPEAIERLQQEMTKEEFAQELCCSFNAPNSGSYYGELLDEAQKEGRICNVPYDPRLPVTTAWDLGMDDCTSIWFVQISRSGEWRVIDHYSNNRGSLADYVRELNARPYTYSRHLLPHDVEVQELGTGKSRKDTLYSLGVRNVVTVPSYSGAVADGIDAVKMVLPRCWFDEKATGLGRKSLKAYRREWNEAAQTWRPTPVHDHASHDADAFRIGAMGAREPRVYEKPDPYGLKRRRGPATHMGV